MTDDSPRVCRPYLTARSQLIPYVEPYYNTYAAPYVNKVQPYIETVEKQIYTPAVEFGKHNYDAYGAPRVEQAWSYGQNQWEKNLHPQWNSGKVQIQQVYQNSLAPHLNNAYEAVAPSYLASRDGVSKIYNNHVYPNYAASRPYVEKSYEVIHKYALDTGLPYAQWAWTKGTSFVDRTLLPTVTILYGKNIKPQLVRISERLGRYRDGKNLKSSIEDVYSSSDASSLPSSLSSVSSSVAAAYTTITQSSNNAETPTPSASPSAHSDPEAEHVREQIARDLGTWQEKFSRAADKGAEDLQARVKIITDRQIDSQAHGVGDALVIKLEETSNSEIAKLKKSIHKLVKSAPEHANTADMEKALDNLSKATRNAGMNVKSKAEALRLWREKYDKETVSLVDAASLSTLEVIDSIRDLGLQEIGIRWAGMEGVSYKDWSNYHTMKSTLDERRSQIETVAKDHPGLKAARNAGEEVESRGMATAEETAKELSRLREVGKWKIEASDDTNDFNTRYIPAGAAGAGRKLMDKIESASDRVVGKSQGSIESIVQQGTSGAADAYGSMSSIAGGNLDQASKLISEKLVGTSTPGAQSVLSAASKKAGQAVLKASEAVKGTPPPPHESLSTAVAGSAQSIASALSDAAYGSSTPLTESASSVVHSASSSASHVATKASKIFAGAMAQKVKEQKPILDDMVNEDDELSYSEKMQSIISQAGDKYADVTRAVSEALLQPTSTQGSVESITSIASEQYSSAFAAASSALYGIQQDAGESVASAVSGKYADAVAA